MIRLPSPRIAAIQLGLNLGLFIAMVQTAANTPGKLLNDFIIFWAAAKLALGGHALSVYDLQSLTSVVASSSHASHIHGGWYYPPAYLLLLLPLGLLNYVPAWLLFSSLSTLLYLVSLSRVVARRDALLWLLAYPGLWLNLYSGQNGLLSLSLLALAMHWQPSRPVRAGIPLGLLIIKPHLGILLPFWLMQQRAWRTMAATTLTVLVLIGVSTFAFGTTLWTGFLQGLMHGGSYLLDNIPLTRLASTYALIRSTGGTVTCALLTHACTALVGLAAAAWIWCHTSSRNISLAGLIAATLLVSPYLYDYDAIWLLLALVCLLREIDATGWRPGEKLWVGLAWFSPLYPLVLSWVVPVGVIQLTPALNIALLLLLLRRTRTAQLPIASVTT